MKHKLLTVIAAIMAMAIAAHAADTGCGAAVEINGQRIELQIFTPHVLRVVKTPVGSDTPSPSLAITAKPDSSVPYKLHEEPSKLTLTTAGLRATIDLRSSTVSFADARGSKLLAEQAPAAFGTCTDLGKTSTTAAQSFRLGRNEAIYGLGNLENGKLSQRGISRTLMPGNIEDGIPVIHSARGYALYWDCFSPTLFSDSDNTTTFSSAPADAVDYYFFAPDGTPDGAIAGMRTISGRVPMMPLWTYGFWQSRERYKSQDEICGVVARYRDIGVPLDGIIQDWQYWGNNYLWNAMDFLNPDFPDPQQMVDSIHAMNAHTIVSIWSSFGPATQQYAELDSLGLLFDISTWPQSGLAHIWPPRMDYPSGVRVYNCYDPEARHIYWRHLSRMHRLGIDGWWMDSTEPDQFDDKMDFDIGGGRSFRRMRGAYPLYTVAGVHDNQLKADSTRRVFILTRSGWFGQQRYGCNVWTGDVASSWDMLRRQVPAHLNFSMTGNPNMNSDLGGFFCGHYNKNGQPAAQNPMFQELTVRWTQLGVFTPMMRSHGADSPREIYQFGKAGEPVFDALHSAIRLRYSLLPYIYSTARMVTARHYSFMRPLAMDFPTDSHGHDLATEYMFGPSLLVAPVLEARFTPETEVAIDENSGWDQKQTVGADASAADFSIPQTTEVYLPDGTDWFNFFTGQRYKGGHTITTSAGLADIPLFARAGSIIPLGPDVQYIGEKPWDQLTLRVFPGADGTFTLYEDEGDGYGYRSGAFTEIPLNYDHRSSTLRIGARQGSYPGMLDSRTFRVVNAATGTSNTVHYDGSPLDIRL